MRTTLLVLALIPAACTLQAFAPRPADAAPARRRASPPPWNDSPARYDKDWGPVNPGGRVHGKPWDCDAHDQCIHPASWFAVSKRSGLTHVAFIVDDKLFAFRGNERLTRVTAHRTRRARAAEIVVGASVFAWDYADPPDSWARSTNSFRWLFGKVRAVDVAAGTFQLDGDHRYRIDQARVSIADRAF